VAGKTTFPFYAGQNRPGVDELPGHGPTDFKAWLQAQARTGYRFCVNPFMHGHVETEIMSAALAELRAYLKQQA
jgi:hypothetical protein